jgi:hypothetical protein
METTKSQVVESPVKVNLPVVEKAEKRVLIERRMTSKGIADDMASRITAKLVGFGDLYDPKTNSFLSESDLVAKGAVFVTISMNKVLSAPSDCVKKGRTTKNPTPFIRKTSKYQVIGNVNWGSYVNKRGHGDFIPDEARANGVENYAECKAIGVTKAGNFTINGVAFRVLENTKYFDENGQEYTDIEFLTSEYLNVASEASKQKEADKHGIELKFDPKYRTTRIDSCNYIRAFGFEYKPTDNI